MWLIQKENVSFLIALNHTKTDYIDEEAGEKYKTKDVGNGSSYCFFLILMN